MSKKKTNFKNGPDNPEEDQGIKLSDILGIVVSHWKLFLIFFIVFIGIVILYIRFGHLKYEIDAAILVESQPSSASGPASMLGAGAGGALGGAMSSFSSLLGITSSAN